MITRFDHAVIAVADLERAVGAYRALGFEVAAGGRHEHRGTHNAIVRFGVEYLELLSVYDPDKAVASGHNGRALVEFLRGREGGLVGYALATDDADADAARFRSEGLKVVGPFEMRRERPDGRVISWRLVVPVDVPWRRPWPFFIQWDEPDDARLRHEQIGGHANGAQRVTGISVAVGYLGEAIGLYELLLDSGPVARDAIPELSVQRASFAVGDFGVDLFAPDGEGAIQAMLADRGEGPFEVRLEVADVDAAGEALTRAGVAMDNQRSGALHVPPELAAGARLVLSGGRL